MPATSAATAELKSQSSITVGFIGPYSWFPQLKYNGSLVVAGYDRIDIGRMSDMSLWGYSSWWYWNQQAMKFAIDQINMDPSILPNTTIKIKRFNNNAYLDRQRASSPGASSPGAAMLVAQEIAIHHPDVIAVFGDFLPRDLAADAEVYSYFQIPQCAGSTLQSSMWDRNKYGYYFQTMALTGYAESIALVLRKWNVRRVAMIETVPFSDPSSNCGYIASVLEAWNFRILAKIVVMTDPPDLDYVAETLGHVDARYIILCATPELASYIYFELAHRKKFVGPEYVWFTDNIPVQRENAVDLWGDEYYRNARGLMSTFGASGMTENMNLQQQIIVDAINRFQSPWGLLFTTEEIQRYFNINQMFTCPMLFAHGLHNLLKDPSLTIEMASTRKLNGYMNSTLFMKTGYRGILGDPVQLTRNGDLATSYTLSYCEGTKSLMTTAFASTDIDSTRIEYIDGQLPIFFDGTSIPPLDGSVYETLLIWPDSQNAFILKIFAGVGVFFAGLFILLIAVFQRNPAIRSGSVPLMSVLAAGSIPSYVSNLLYIGRPSVYKCHLAVWLQSLAFAIMSAAIIFKNLRVVLIYGAKTILPKYAVRDWFWMRFVGGLVAGELILLCAWSYLSQMYVLEKTLPDHFIEFTCTDRSAESPKLVYAMWIYNSLVYCALVTVTVKSHNVGPTHTEFTLLLVTSICLTISVILALTMDQEIAIQYQIKVSTLVFFNTTVPILMQAVPRIARLIKAEVFGDNGIHFSKLKWSLVMKSQLEPESEKESERSLKSANSLSMLQMQSVIAVGSSLKKARVKSSQVYYVIYCVKEWCAPAYWVRGGVSYTIVRGNVFFLFHPPTANSGAESCRVFQLSNAKASGNTVECLQHFILINDQHDKFERLEVTANKQHAVLDFVGFGDGEKFKNGLDAVLNQLKKAKEK